MMIIADRSLHILIYFYLTLICVGGEPASCPAEPVINCQNGGTQLDSDTCVCPSGLFGKNCNHSMYFSFDTLKDLTLIQGSKQMAFDGLVQGRVNSAVSLNGALKQSIDLGFHPKVCLSHKFGCGKKGAAVSFWLKMPKCTGGIITTVQGFRSGQASGFNIICFGGLRFLLLLKGEYFYTISFPFQNSDWFHVVFNFNGRNKVPEYGFYYDGIRQTSETQKFGYRKFPEPHHRAARDGRIIIVRFHSDENLAYGSFVMDELVFFNRVLNEEEIKMMNW